MQKIIRNPIVIDLHALLSDCIYFGQRNIKWKTMVSVVESYHSIIRLAQICKPWLPHDSTKKVSRSGVAGYLVALTWLAWGVWSHCTPTSPVCPTQ